MPIDPAPPDPRRPAAAISVPLRRALAAAAVGLAASLSLVSAQPTQPPGTGPAPAEPQPPNATQPANGTQAPQTTQPAQAPQLIAASYPMAEMLPDSEFVYGPSLYGFDLPAFVAEQGGYLAGYQESVDGVTLSGADIVDRVGQDFSISTRLLLALIQADSGWVGDAAPVERTFAVGEPLPGLYPGLSVAAEALNGFYYGHRYDGLRVAPLAGGGSVEIPGGNAATFALLAYLGRGATAQEWAGLEQPSRFYAAWMALFGDPSNYVGETAVATQLPPVDLKLPFPAGETWYFIAGPHSPWGAKGPRAAVDFAPPPAELTVCFPTGAWVTAVTTGKVTRVSASSVVVSLQGSEFEGTGWAHVYTHLGPLDRVAEGKRVRAGDPLGHPGCEGGLPTQTRVSFARKYQGEWVPASSPEAPLMLDGWTALPGAEPGEGFLIRTGAAPRTASPQKSEATNGVTAGGVPAGP